MLRMEREGFGENYILFKETDNGEIQFPSMSQAAKLSASNIRFLHCNGWNGFHTSVPSEFEVGEVMEMDLSISVAGL
jgi:hypothetical protein